MKPMNIEIKDSSDKDRYIDIKKLEYYSDGINAKIYGFYLYYPFFDAFENPSFKTSGNFMRIEQLYQNTQNARIEMYIDEHYAEYLI